MPQFNSPGATPNGMPMYSSAHLGKLVGTKKTFPTLTALNTAITADKANALWGNNEELGVATEVPALRLWDSTAKHARTVRIEGTQFTLDADDDNVLFAVGVPAGGTGAVGDVSVDTVNRMIYKKTGATTWVAYLKVGAKVPWDTPRTITGPLTLADMNRVVPVNAAGVTTHTLPLAADAWALQPGGFIELFIQGAGIPVFAVQAGQAALLGTAGGAQYNSIAARVISPTQWVVQS